MALIAVLSLLPAEDMVRTGLGGHIEHAAAYAGTALLAGVGFSRHGLGRIAAMLVVYAGVLEPLQHFSPAGIRAWTAGRRAPPACWPGSASPASCVFHVIVGGVSTASWA
jgi:hypothetical protein